MAECIRDPESNNDSEKVYKVFNYNNNEGVVDQMKGDDDTTTNASPDQFTQAQKQANELIALIRTIQKSYNVIVPVDV